MSEYIELPNGTGLEIMNEELIAELVVYGKLEVMTDNYVVDSVKYTLLLSKKTNSTYAVLTA